MRRVLVIGCPGAGKSTLTRALAETLACRPSIWTGCGGSPVDQPHPRGVRRPAGRGPGGDAWVMDGNYLRTLPRRLERCDAVLFLDYPRRLCLFRPSGGSCAGAGAPAPTWPRAARAAGPGVHPLDLGFPPHPAAPGAGASVRLEGRGASSAAPPSAPLFLHSRNKTPLGRNDRPWGVRLCPRQHQFVQRNALRPPPLRAGRRAVRVSDGQNVHRLQVLRQAEGRLHRLRLEVTDPHRAQPQGRRRQHHVVGEDGRVDVCGLLAVKGPLPRTAPVGAHHHRQGAP